jgi:hypothetical protein
LADKITYCGRIIFPFAAEILEVLKVGLRVFLAAKVPERNIRQMRLSLYQSKHSGHSGIHPWEFLKANKFYRSYSKKLHSDLPPVEETDKVTVHDGRDSSRIRHVKSDAQ